MVEAPAGASGEVLSGQFLIILTTLVSSLEVGWPHPDVEHGNVNFQKVSIDEGWS